MGRVEEKILQAKLLLRARVDRLREDHPGYGITLATMEGVGGEPNLWFVHTSIPYAQGFEAILPGGLLTPYAIADQHFVFALGYVAETELGILSQAIEDAMTLRAFDIIGRSVIADAGEAPKGTPAARFNENLDLENVLEWQELTFSGVDAPLLPVGKDFLRRLVVHDFGSKGYFRFQAIDPAQPNQRILALRESGVPDPVRRVRMDPGGSMIGFLSLPEAAQQTVINELHPFNATKGYGLKDPDRVTDAVLWLLNNCICVPAVAEAWHKAVAHTYDGDLGERDVVLHDGGFWAVTFGLTESHHLTNRMAPDEGDEGVEVLTVPLLEHEERADRGHLLRFLDAACPALVAEDEAVIANRKQRIGATASA